MPKATCGICHQVYDSRSMRLCPECNRYVCKRCQGDERECPECAENFDR